MHPSYKRTKKYFGLTIAQIGILVLLGFVFCVAVVGGVYVIANDIDPLPTHVSISSTSALDLAKIEPTSTPTITNTSTHTDTPTPTDTPTSTPTPTPVPTLTSTPTLEPMGEIQTNPNDYVYLGDPNLVALGFDLKAGGAIGKMLYLGLDMVNHTDFGRYIQFSPYDGNEKYICNSSSCYKNWGWNPLQAGSVDGLPGKVEEFRRFDNGLYIKAHGVEWGYGKGVSDVIYETWAWDRGDYFEIHTRLTHEGQDTHAYADAEFPAAYFSTALKYGYGYTGLNPFSGEAMLRFDYSGNNLVTNSPIYPTEHWMAFGTEQGVGLILALPEQPYLTPFWAYGWIPSAAPGPLGYTAPQARFQTPPSATVDLTYYLIPGPLDKGRSIVYDLIPHTSWNFDEKSTEGWVGTGNTFNTQDGTVLTSLLSPGDGLTSSANLDTYGYHSPSVEMTARAQDVSATICLSFITADDWVWNDQKTTCLPVQNGDYQDYHFDFSTNEVWMNGLVKQLRISSATPSILEIDHMQIETQFYGWEFNNPQGADGWYAISNLTPLVVDNGTLDSSVTGSDPSMGSPYLGVDAAAFNKLVIRMRTTAGSNARILFTTNTDPYIGGEKSQSFTLIDDGDWHEYSLDMSTNGEWIGSILQIQLVPMDTPGDFQVDYIRVEPGQ